jgi:hypothetical protein
MARFVEPPASGGLRIPVFFTPDRGDDLPPGLDSGEGLDLEASEHTLVVVLADARMARVVHDGTGKAWRAFIEQTIAKAPIGSSPHHVVPVALDERAFDLSERQHFLPATLKPQEGSQDASDRKACRDLAAHRREGDPAPARGEDLPDQA